MALFLGGGRPLLAGIMTLVMVQPLTSSDTSLQSQVWSYGCKYIIYDKYIMSNLVFVFYL